MALSQSPSDMYQEQLTNAARGRTIQPFILEQQGLSRYKQIAESASRLETPIDVPAPTRARSRSPRSLHKKAGQEAVMAVATNDTSSSQVDIGVLDHCLVAQTVATRTVEVHAMQFQLCCTSVTSALESATSKLSEAQLSTRMTQQTPQAAAEADSALQAAEAALQQSSKCLVQLFDEVTAAVAPISPLEARSGTGSMFSMLFPEGSKSAIELEAELVKLRGTRSTSLAALKAHVSTIGELSQRSQNLHAELQRHLEAARAQAAVPAPTASASEIANEDHKGGVAPVVADTGDQQAAVATAAITGGVEEQAISDVKAADGDGNVLSPKAPGPFLMARAAARLTVVSPSLAEIAGEYRLLPQPVLDRPAFSRRNEQAMFLYWSTSHTYPTWTFGRSLPTAADASNGDEVVARSLQAAWTVLPEELACLAWTAIGLEGGNGCSRVVDVSILQVPQSHAGC